MRLSTSREIELEAPAAISGSLEGGGTSGGAPRSPLLTQPQTAASHNPEFSAQTPRVLDVVLVDDLRDALLELQQGGTAEIYRHGVDRLNSVELLKVLANTSEYIKEVNTSDTPCALVSYRQERHTSESDAFEELTMDGDALIGVLSAAQRLGVKGLWCDAWCYRSTGEYNHDEFINTLHNVMTSVVGVVWLPRSKAGSRGEYQYRLWTTFEASCVEVRRLPVAVAGIGMSNFQKRVRLLGSFTPALAADGTITELCRLNLFFYSVMMVILAVCLISDPPQPIDWAFLGMMIIMWLSWRGSIGQQLRLAGNARRVLCAMSNANAKAVQLLREDERPSRNLVQDLPWLPAHDRRDVLIVQTLIHQMLPEIESNAAMRGSRANAGADPSNAARDRSLSRFSESSGKSRDSEIVRALAFSAYVAARLQPSQGDKSALEVSLSEWLREVDYSLETVGGLSSKRADGSSLDGAMWYNDLASSSATPSACVPLHALRHFGWIAAPGASCALISPLGALRVEVPAEGIWSVRSGTGFPPLVNRPRLYLAGTFCFAIVTFLRPWPIVARTIRCGWSDWRALPVGDNVSMWIHAIIVWMVMFPLALIYYGYVTFGDELRSCTSAQRFFFPLPGVVFNRLWHNYAVTTCVTSVTVFWWFQVSAPIVGRLVASSLAEVMAPHMVMSEFGGCSVPSDSATKAIIANNFAAFVNNSLILLLFGHQAVLLCVFVVYATLRRHVVEDGRLG